MQEKRKVISYQNLPTSLRLNNLLLYYMALQYFEASDVVKGVVYTLIGIALLASIIGILTTERVDIFKKDN